jgi:hypothetical protein
LPDKSPNEAHRDEALDKPLWADLYRRKIPADDYGEYLMKEVSADDFTPAVLSICFALLAGFYLTLTSLAMYLAEPNIGWRRLAIATGASGAVISGWITTGAKIAARGSLPKIEDFALAALIACAVFFGVLFSIFGTKLIVAWVLDGFRKR